jgi:hypothetical protein
MSPLALTVTVRYPYNRNRITVYTVTVGTPTIRARSSVPTTWGTEASLAFAHTCNCGRKAGGREERGGGAERGKEERRKNRPEDARLLVYVLDDASKLIGYGTERTSASRSADTGGRDPGHSDSVTTRRGWERCRGRMTGRLWIRAQNSSSQRDTDEMSDSSHPVHATAWDHA